MKEKSSASGKPQESFKLSGRVSDQGARPLSNLIVRVYNKAIRGTRLLGETITDDKGGYSISFEAGQKSSLPIIVQVYNAKNNLLAESDAQHKIPALLDLDMVVNDHQVAPVSSFDNLVGAIIPLVEDIPLSQLTESGEHKDISFIAEKASLTPETVERVAMAYRFEKITGIVPALWYAILNSSQPVSSNPARIRHTSKPDFETKLLDTLDSLMHTAADTLVQYVERGIEKNIIDSSFKDQLEKVREQLRTQVHSYSSKHPVTGKPSRLYQKAQLAGLKDAALQSFIEAYTNHTGSEDDLWQQGKSQFALAENNSTEKLQAVFHLSTLTGDDLELTEKLVQSKKIKSVSDVKKLAALDRDDWETLISKNGSTAEQPAFQKVNGQKQRDRAARLEATFTRAFPTAAFTARLQKDKTNKFPHKDKISKFLNENDHFDLLNSRIGQFLDPGQNSLAGSKNLTELAGQLRRVQRVFKLAPTYEATQVLMNDNIHSAQQVYKMGKDNFIKTYGEKVGANEAEEVFQKATQAHATAVALVGNLRSMADASTLNAFPDFALTINQTLVQELPSIETLFGHTDYCDVPESRSVYGAPAYLTDLLHFLDQRRSTLPPTADKVPSVKDLLLRRRPDIAALDLEPSNSDTEIPYIDIACEIMENYIAPPVITINNIITSQLGKGPINASVLSEIKNQFTAAGLTNVSSLLTSNANVSDPYVINKLGNDNILSAQTNWMIRDSQGVFRLSALTEPGAFEVRLEHQTLQSSDTISTGPEYTNINAYNKFLKTAKSPFTLPFDLFETEGKLYLERLGVKKADLINTFRKEDKLAPGASPTDLQSAYASLGINEAEQTLIFVPDPTHQSLYWNDFATATVIEVNIFEKMTGLNYNQVTDLIQLQFINPAKDIVIEHDDLSPDTTTQRIINLTAARLDAIHRFLRLWRKTPLTMVELDAIIMSTVLGQGKIIHKLAWQLQLFLFLQQRLQLSAFQLLAFYQNLDITHNLPDCLYNQLFQNSAITNPVSPNFSITAATPGTLGINPPDKAVIAAVLQISINDVDALITRTFSRIAFTPLSVMYRHVQLARSLDIPLSELLTLLNLIDANPFLDPNGTCLFLQKYKLLQLSGLSADELNYVLRHKNDKDQSLVPANSQVSDSLTQLRDELLTARFSSQPAIDPNGLLLNKWLSDTLFKWDTNLLHKLTDTLNTVDDEEYKQKIDDNSNFLFNLRIQYRDTVITTDLAALPLTQTTPAVPISFPASIAFQLTFDADKKQLQLTGYMSQADLDLLKTLSADASYLAAIQLLFNSAQLTDNSPGNIFIAGSTDLNNLKNISNSNIADRFALFVNKISPVYRKLLQQEVLVRNISTWFRVDKKIASQLLVSFSAVYTDFTDDNFVNRVPVLNDPAGPYPLQFNRFQFVAKACFIARKLQLSEIDLGFLSTYAVNINTLNFSILPLVPVETAVTSFPTFENLVNLLRFQQHYPLKTIDDNKGTTVSIYTILEDAISKGALTGTALATYIAGLIDNLVLLTGWNKTELIALISTPNYLTFSLPADIKSVPILMRLHQRFDVLQQLGISANDVVAWCKPSLLIADVTKIKQVLKLRYSSSDWLEVTKPLQDVLREKKRDALIAYLLANPGQQTWKNANDLYSHFLLDVEMSSCQPTSRIVQATNSVQLFVQRCFLGLESSVVVNSKEDSDWNQWKWMKNFRVWQANVKVFLYPENWIEPELLPKEIKSPFLKELEDELLQNEVTATSTEDAFRNYLSKLDGVARLEVKGMWYDDPSRTLHVFARTYGGDGKTYYHRRLIDNRRWTSWVKIDLDINSDHIIPVVSNNRVYLFWAVFMEVPGDQPTSIDIPVIGEPYNVKQPEKNWQIKLAFSEYKDGNWTPKKISDADDSGQITVPQDPGASVRPHFPSKSSFVFTPFDLPAFEINDLFDENGNPRDVETDPAFLEKFKNLILENGTLVINCYYYHHYAGFFQHVGGFELDPRKGYPITRHVGYLLDLTIPANSNFSNMLVKMNDQAIIGRDNTNDVFMPNRKKGPFRNLIPMQMGIHDRSKYLYDVMGGGLINRDKPPTAGMGFMHPHFYQDQHRTYYVKPLYSDDGAFKFDYDDFLNLLSVGIDESEAILAMVYSKNVTGEIPILRYFNFYHPLVDFFTLRSVKNGIAGLMDRDTQLKGDVAYDSDPNKFTFKDYFNPGIDIYGDHLRPVTYANGVVDQFPGYPKDDVDFSPESGYGLYNWELFFHAPLHIAERLSQNHQFEEADLWYKYIFNPMDLSADPAPDKYWNTKPFFINVNDKYNHQRIENILKNINGDDQDLLRDVTDWRRNPFQPHYIAEYRTVAYQKAVVMKYVGHLIRHGDHLFRQGTRESINEATQIYILVSEILGPKPQTIPPATLPVVDNYFQLEQRLDAFSNALVDVENLLPLQTIKGYNGTIPTTQGLPNLQTLYFSIPMNENLVGPTGYWDTVADRLFKIRHCLDINGTFTPLSLFAPAIDPGILLRASSAGLDIGDILSDANAPLPVYRFMVMLQKATELCHEVKSLGAALLSALVNKDAETMALLRSGHEVKLQSAMQFIKQKQEEDAKASYDILSKQKELITIRRNYYDGLLKKGLSFQESKALGLMFKAKEEQKVIAHDHRLDVVLNLMPTLNAGLAGFGGSPTATLSFGGTNIAQAANAFIAAKSADMSVIEKTAAITNSQASYNRRSDEWTYQFDLAEKELEHIEKQLAGAQIRLDMAKRDKENQQLQIDQAKEANEFMRSKFTNEELYNWMSTQISTTYFKSYQLAYDVAKQAERCFRYELGLADSAYINFGYWDSLKKGLLAGEKLSYDLKKMEVAYCEQNKRELELTRHIPLSQLDPVALMKLKTTGECWINLPEELFDMDYPGHYMRRIKSVSVTMPCITGPYTTVSCKLTMTKNSVRISGVASDASQYSRKLSNGIPTDDPRFRDAVGALQSIATSSAQNDSGLFELNFRDERYLPFEGAGAISLWHMQLPAAVRQFDYNTISDVIIHLKYTARDGGELLRKDATESLATKINQMLVSLKDRGLMRVVSAKHDLPTEWYRFLHPANVTDDQVLTVNLDETRFPLFVQGKTIKIKSVELVADSTTTAIQNIQFLPAGATNSLNLTETKIYGSWLSGSINYETGKKDPGTWTFKNPSTNTRLTEESLKNLVIILQYEVS